MPTKAFKFEIGFTVSNYCSYIYCTVIKKGIMLLSTPVRLAQRDSQFVWAGSAEPTKPIGLYCCRAASTEWSVPTMNVR